MEAFFSFGKIARSLADRERANELGFWLAFAVSSISSVLLILALRYSHLEVNTGELIADARNGLNCFLSGHHLPWSGECHPVSEVPDLKAISNKIHAPPGLGIGACEILGIGAISFMWVYAVICRRKLYLFLSLLATLAYIYSMFQSYQPAVLAAALIAIIAAAQHLGTLHDQAGKVDQQLTSLGQQGVTLNTTLDRVSRIASSTQLSLNDTGKEIFIQDVYRAYGKARTIYAVIRDHGIEQEWWSHALETADTRQDGLKKVWEWYYGPAEKNSKLDLYRALTGPRRQDDVGEVVGVRAAYFVSYMPMPDFSNQGAATTDWNSDKSGLFKDLLGLAWECLVLDKVRSELKNAELIGEWISRPLCWAHATEKEVLQVVKRVPDTESTVFKTADLGTSELNNLDPGMSKKVIESMQAEIRRYLQRGVPAEEYLCALIGYASAYDAQSVLHENPESHLCDDKIAAYLSRMHMDEWIKDQQQHARDQSRSLAVAIFKEFLHMCWTRSQVGLDKKIAEPTDQTLFLAREVL